MRFRLNKQLVLLILEEIREKLEFVTNWNNTISPMEQLLLTLRIYATGSFLITMDDFSGVSTILPKYRIRNKAKTLRFYNVACFPRIVGCINCAHVHIGENAELFRNRKDYFSLNIQTVCNSNLSSAKNFFVFKLSQQFFKTSEFRHSPEDLLLNECSITFQHFSLSFEITKSDFLFSRMFLYCCTKFINIIFLASEKF
ncbi:HARB1 nuclease, partial [Acromyrmex charruanus]